MIEQLFKDVYNEKEAEDAIINDRCGGHKEDYLALHCLLRKYKPKTFFEIGTHTGWGTMIIKNALGNESNVFSLDLPNNEAQLSAQHPSAHNQNIGVECTLSYFQLLGNSLKFDFSAIPCEGYFVDGEHTFYNVLKETLKIARERPKIIIWHDADVPDVLEALEEALRIEAKGDYTLYRITDTRIAYALKNIL